jgi:pimeloyl-ACP methyl ester carboxylesterase
MKSVNRKIKTVVFVHGAWMTPLSWDKFKTRFEAAGYNVLTPTWPYMDRSIDDLRNHPAKEFGSLTVGKIADHYEAIIRRLPEAPLLVGHSFGGLIIQLLLDRGVGVAGIAIDPAPIGGIIADPISLSAALPAIVRLGGWNKPFVLSKEAFDANFANTAPAGIRATEYQRLVVPAPGRIFYKAASGIGTGVDSKNRKQPLLFISAEKDRSTAPPLVKAAYRKQKRSAARTDLKEFSGLSHFLIGEPGWENVADAAINWGNEVL